MDARIYDEGYFERGRETGKSLYERYRWLESLTVPMVKCIVSHLGITTGDKILDFGCAKGFVVKAFRLLGYQAWGVDCSQWAIDNADEAVKGFVECGTRAYGSFDWVIAKDVLEHVADVEECIDSLMGHARKGVFAVVPLSIWDNTPYMVAEYELDVTHIHRLCLSSWAKMFMRPGWSVEARYRLEGCKDNYSQWDRGNGFLVARRLS